MAVIYLRHLIHGEKVACSEMEAKHDREQGWQDFDPSTPALPAFLGGGTAESDLPTDFPGREALIEGGVTTWANVVGKTVEELQAIKGIGPATAKSILERVNS